jgi:[protein-PII] uridylyltransferase
VDVLVLFKKKIPDEAKSLVQEIFYPLWDLGFEVGYTIRTLKECTHLASHDLPVCTSLLDARFLCGMSLLYTELLEELHEKVIPWRKGALIKWLVDTSQERHNLYGDSTYLLEPNLKEGLGGLRDYHTLLWLAHIAYEVREPRDLEFYGHLSHLEFQELTQALCFVWKVRNWLHHLSGRKTDRLYFEYQIKLAEALKFEKYNGQEPVERFLGVLHGHMELLKQHHLMMLHKVGKPNGKHRPGKTVLELAAKGLEIDQDTINFESSEAILEDPHLLIQIFEYSARLGVSLHTEAKRLIREFLYLITDEFRGAEPVAHSFRRIMTSPGLQQLSVLNEMLSTGILAAFIPEIGGIINRVQYDAYHLYPVDKHSLRTVETLKGFHLSGRESGEALYQKLFPELQRSEIVLWAGFLHDIGKGGGERGRHAWIGAELAGKVLQRMEFSSHDRETISFLIREHLLLIETATRRDINDETVVIRCARTIGSIERLKMLYLLTVADSMATGPKAWNDWIERLLNELFFKIHGTLERGELATSKAAQTVERKRIKLFETCKWLPRPELEVIFEQLSPRYLLYTSTKDILRHIHLYSKLGDEPFVWEVDEEKGTKYRTVIICAKDQPGLFSKISGVFTLNSMDILSAEIHTWRNHIALDIFKVKAPPDEFREQEIWKKAEDHLKSALNGSLDLYDALHKKFLTYQPAQGKPQGRSPKIAVDNHSSKFFSIIEIYTTDYPGLLFSVTDALFRCRLDVWVAKIATKVDQVVDVFYVRDFDGQKATDREQVEAIKAAVLPVLNLPVRSLGGDQ